MKQHAPWIPQTSEQLTNLQKHYAEANKANIEAQMNDPWRRGNSFSYAMSINPNPKHFKYLWQIRICQPIPWEKLSTTEACYKSYPTDPDGPNKPKEDPLNAFILEHTHLTPRDLEFFPDLSHAVAQNHFDFLRENKIAFYYKNVRLVRNDPNSPFDLNHPRWINSVYAPPLDQDPDPETKTGHR